MRYPIQFLGVVSALVACTPQVPVADPIGERAGCEPVLTDDNAWYASGKDEPLFEGLTGVHYTITTSSDSAQRYFDQGLTLAYGFNHAEAARSFWQAGREDSTCAMASRGFAYAPRPNYNAGMEADRYERAYTAIQKARSLAGTCTEKERALINAMAARYSPEAPEDRSTLDKAYSEAMRTLSTRYPEDPDIAAMFAESLMDQHPWDLWAHDGTAKEWTPEILAALESSMRTWPDHPGAHHFYIHAVEASRDPERGLPSADLLRDRVPASGHLVHMPSHIYIRTGRYHDGVLANKRSVRVDSGYTAACHAQGMYPIAYFPHNIHFLSACAAMEGNSATAWSSALHLREKVLGTGLLKEPGWETLQHFWAYPLFVAVKFARWDDLGAEAPPDSTMPYAMAIWEYAQGMSALGRSDITAAGQRLAALKTLASDTALQELKIWGINPASEVVRIAQEVLEGELLAAQNKHDEAIAILRIAAEHEDALNYQEPPDWSFPVRHTLGDVLVKAGRYDEAIATYDEDLAVWKENGWSLIGKKVALEAAGRKAEAADVRQRFERAWAHSDLPIGSSRIF